MDPFPIQILPPNVPQEWLAEDKYPINRWPRDEHGPLEKLSAVEERLIAKVAVVQKVYRLSNGIQRYQGNVLNLEQNVEEIVSQLPRTLDTAGIIIVRKPNHSGADDPNGYIDFRVRRREIERWLIFLKNHSLPYHDIEISRENLNVLPESGTVGDRLPQIEEQAAEELENRSNLNLDDDDDDVPQQNLGPEQGGASGAMANEDSVHIGYMGESPERLQNGSVNEQIRQEVMHWAGQATAPLNDFRTQNLQAMAFPTLFPYGVADVTRQTRNKTVTMAQANFHLLKYALWNSETKMYDHPFVQHDTWLHWAYNTCERHRTASQKRLVFRRTPELENIDEETIQQYLDEANNGDRSNLQKLISQMGTYVANINGSPSYLQKSKKELEALMSQCGMPTLWFSFSAAENFWTDMHRFLDPSYDERDDEFTSLEEKFQFYRKRIRENPHLVELFFFERFKTLIKHFFGSDSPLKAVWWWFRAELQERGMYHVHGCLRLECDPGLTSLATVLLKGRKAQRKLKQHGVQLDVDTDQCFFAAEDTASDKHFEDNLDNNGAQAHGFQQQLNTAEIDKLFEAIKAGIEAQQKIVQFQDLLLSTMTPPPTPEDAQQDSRDEATVFKPDNENRHPSSYDSREGSSVKESTINKLVTVLLRHTHRAYCGVTDAAGKTAEQLKKICRFGFGKDLVQTTHIAWIATEVVHRDGTREHVDRLEVMAKRNDQWVNSHCVPILSVWLANNDVQLTIDIGKIIGYMTKYVTKVEPGMTRGLINMTRRLLTQTMHAGQSVQLGLRRVMSRLLGNRVTTKQEMCHLIRSAPTVECSHKFITIDLENNSRNLFEAPTARNQEPSGETALVVKKTYIDLYQERHEANVWLDEALYLTYESELEDMTLAKFCETFRVGGRGVGRNNIWEPE